jgi:DNA-binding GntR family transcriptional regulator
VIKKKSRTVSEKLKHQSLGEEIYKWLLRRILDGRLKSGAPLREEELCRRIGASRTPLREALIRLEREGIVERRPRRGCVARGLDLNGIGQLMECRAMTECLILRRWFHRLDKDGFGAVAARLEKAAALTDSAAARAAALAADEDIHNLILAACENRFLAEHLERLKMLCRPYRALRCSDQEDTASVIAERRRVADAILDGDTEKAAAALESHFELSRRYYTATV